MTTFAWAIRPGAQIHPLFNQLGSVTEPESSNHMSVASMEQLEELPATSTIRLNSETNVWTRIRDGVDGFQSANGYRAPSSMFRGMVAAGSVSIVHRAEPEPDKAEAPIEPDTGQEPQWFIDWKNRLQAEVHEYLDNTGAPFGDSLEQMLPRYGMRERAGDDIEVTIEVGGTTTVAGQSMPVGITIPGVPSDRVDSIRIDPMPVHWDTTVYTEKRSRGECVCDSITDEEVRLLLVAKGITANMNDVEYTASCDND